MIHSFFSYVLQTNSSNILRLHDISVHYIDSKIKYIHICFTFKITYTDSYTEWDLEISREENEDSMFNWA